MTDPLVPADVDLRNFGYMPLDVLRLRDSDLAALASGDEFKAAVMLWCAAWHQLPAASLPADDRMLARFAGLGAAEWKRVKDVALRGFVECGDGRLYHSTIAEKALEAWASKAAQRARTKAATEARAATRRSTKPQRDVERNGERDDERNADRDDIRNVERNVHQGRGEERRREEDAARLPARAHEAPPEEPNSAMEASVVGRACRAIRQAGLQSVNPSDPRLFALLAQGVSVDELTGIATEAVVKGKGWGWLLATVEGRRRDAAQLAIAPKTEPADGAAAAAERLADTQRLLAQQDEHRRLAREEFLARKAKEAMT